MAALYGIVGDNVSAGKEKNSSRGTFLWGLTFYA
jgi:hypothetical protein